jgi:hypothetical protein
MAVYGYVRIATVTQARGAESLEARHRQVMSHATAKGLALLEENVFAKAADDND